MRSQLFKSLFFTLTPFLVAREVWERFAHASGGYVVRPNKFASPSEWMGKVYYDVGGDLEVTNAGAGS